MEIREPIYNIADEVYHKTPESGKGIIIDINYSLLTRMYRYNVVFGRGPEDNVWYFGHELSDSQIF